MLASNPGAGKDAQQLMPISRIDRIAQGVDQRQCGQRSLRLPDGDRTIEFDDRRWLHQRHDTVPQPPLPYRLITPPGT